MTVPNVGHRYQVGKSASSFSLSMASMNIGDLMILAVETSNQAVSTPAGWTIMTGSPWSLGSAANVNGIRLSVFYKYATSTSESVTVPDSGDHQTAILFSTTDARSTNPFHDIVVSTGTTGTTVSSPSLNNQYNDSAYVFIPATGADSTTPFTTASNSTIGTLSRLDGTGSTDGNGGGVTVFYADNNNVPPLGTIAGSSSTAPTSAPWIGLAFMIRGTTPVGITASTGSFQVQPYGYGSADLYKTNSDGSITIEDFEASFEAGDTKLSWAADDSTNSINYNTDSVISVGSYNSSHQTEGLYCWDVIQDNGTDPGSGGTDILLDSFETITSNVPTGGVAGITWRNAANIGALVLNGTRSAVTTYHSEGTKALQITKTLAGDAMGLASGDWIGSSPTNASYIDITGYNVAYDVWTTSPNIQAVLYVLDINGVVVAGNAGTIIPDDGTLTTIVAGPVDSGDLTQVIVAIIFFGDDGVNTVYVDKLRLTTSEGGGNRAPILVGETISQNIILKKDYLAVDINPYVIPSGGLISVGLYDPFTDTVVDNITTNSTGQQTLSFDLSSYTTGDFSSGAEIIISAADLNTYPVVPSAYGEHKYYIDNMRITDSVALAYTLEATTQSFALTGQSVNFNRTYKLEAAPAALTMTGQNASLISARSMISNPGTFIFTTIDAQLNKGGTLAALPGAFALTGQTAQLSRTAILTADSGTFTFSGISANLLKQFNFSASSAAFTMTGQAAGLFNTRKIEAPYEPFTLTGQTATMVYGRKGYSDAGSFAFTGQTVNLKKVHYVYPPTIQFGFQSIAPKIATGSSALPPEIEFEVDFIVPYFVGERPFTRVSPPTRDFAFDFPDTEVATGVNAVAPTIEFKMRTGIQYFKIQLVACVGSPAPVQHIADSKKLEADAYVELFDIILSDNVTRILLKQNSNVTWQGQTYEGTGIQIEGVARYADDQLSRPKLTIFNPQGVFSYLIDQGHLENAIVKRTRVLKEHIDADLPVYRVEQWRVARVANVKKGFIGLELRGMLDGQNFLTPGRMFIPPDFPTVSLN